MLFASIVLAAQEATTRIVGRVVDSMRLPLSAVEIRASSNDESWNSSVDVRSFVTTTDADGRFALEVPTPTAERVEFEVVPDRYHLRHELDFGLRAWRPRLASGTHDLGEISLAVAGAFAGSVVDERGRPLASVSVYADGSGWDGGSVETAADGTFVLAHFAGGPFKICARAEGRLRAETLPLPVRPGETVGGISLRLRPGPMVHGEVVDVDGRPVADARVDAEFGHGNGGGSDRTDAQGRFELALSSFGRPRFVVRARGFLTLDESEVLGHRGHDLADFVRLVVQPYVEVPTVRRSPLRMLTGRVVKDGRPVGDALVRVWQRSLVEFASEEGTLEFDEDDYLWSDWDAYNRDLSWFIDGCVEVRSARDGRFEIEVPDSGGHRVDVITESGERLTRDPIEVPKLERATDLGDLELVPAGVLRGRVLLPAGCSPAGLAVYDWPPVGVQRDRTLQAVTDAEGRFAIPNAPAGTHHVSVSPAGDWLLSPAFVAARLRGGDEAEFEFDLRPLVRCEPRLDVSIETSHRERVLVEFVPLADPSAYCACWTNDVGLVRTWLPAVGRSNVRVRSAHGLPLGSWPDAANLAPASRAELRFDAQAGRLSLKLPSLEAGRAPSCVRLSTLANESPGWRCEVVDPPLDGDLGWIAPGEYECTLVLEFAARRESRSYRRTVRVQRDELCELAFGEADRIGDER